MIVLMLMFAAAQTGDARIDSADFVRQAKAYMTFVTVHCSSEVVQPYRDFNHRRDAAFVRSLKNTSFEAIYRAAVREQQAQDERTVYECFGPPPPPPPLSQPARPLKDPRSAYLADRQKRLRNAAEELPAFFDRADTLFAAMVAARDGIVTKGTH
ncbi:hypothetical protein [Sphingomonas bacterium]|uniref:hypothetical protein n=1 Tax=Sphingomonas bacterium TaxID=1895847 RepID=UPI001576AA57|nr:hypothetical protein [Sphingomonas bacterium]